jgi:hypothetical protein
MGCCCLRIILFDRDAVLCPLSFHRHRLAVAAQAKDSLERSRAVGSNERVLRAMPSITEAQITLICLAVALL